MELSGSAPSPGNSPLTPSPPPSAPRRGGVVCHITSLPCPWGNGDLGPSAYRFVDWLRESHFSVWQVLPLGPTEASADHSPYMTLSTFAGNPLLISLQAFVASPTSDGDVAAAAAGAAGAADDDGINGRDGPSYPSIAYEKFILPEDTNLRGLLEASDLKEEGVEDEEWKDDRSREHVNLEKSEKRRHRLLDVAYKKWRERHGDESEKYKKWKEEESYWIENWGNFMGLRNVYGPDWRANWPMQLRTFHRNKIQRKDHKASSSITAIRSLLPESSRARFDAARGYHLFLQYSFYSQWKALKDYANLQGVALFGDMPIYVSDGSADVWCCPELFELTKDDSMAVLGVSGVPPDYFSSRGQLWGHPVYDWATNEDTSFEWWKNRVSSGMQLFDFLRIDHFRAFESYWRVSADYAEKEKDAAQGEWIRAPGRKLFEHLRKHHVQCSQVESDAVARMKSDTMASNGKETAGSCGSGVSAVNYNDRIIAEDLGDITQEVLDLRDALGFSGMKVLHFAFGATTTEDLPSSSSSSVKTKRKIAEGNAPHRIWCGANSHLPHLWPYNCVGYVGTHDNNTTEGWWVEDASEMIREHFTSYAGLAYCNKTRITSSSSSSSSLSPVPVNGKMPSDDEESSKASNRESEHCTTIKNVCIAMMRMAWQSHARMTMVCLQDLCPPVKTSPEEESIKHLTTPSTTDSSTSTSPRGTARKGGALLPRYSRRLNYPGSSGKQNWSWQLPSFTMISAASTIAVLKELNTLYGRSPFVAVS